MATKTKTDDEPTTEAQIDHADQTEPATDAAPVEQKIVRLSATRLNRAQLNIESALKAIERVENSFTEMLFGRGDSEATHVVAMWDAAKDVVGARATFEKAGAAVSGVQSAVRDFQ